MSLKVAQLTTVHSPGDTRVYHRICRTLAGAGYQVVLIAPGAPGDGAGVRLRGLPQPRGRGERATRSAWQLYRAALDERADVYHFHDPELIPVGLALRARTGKPVIYDAHEDVPLAMANKHWLPRPLRPLAAGVSGGLEAAGSRRLSAVIAATPGIAAKFPGGRTVLVRNYAATDEVAPGPTPYAERPALFVYAGRISVERGSGEMIDALAAVAGARLALAGNFAPARLQRELAARAGWERVEFVGWQTRAGLGRLLGRARGGLVTLRPVRQYVDALPVKLFEYMAAGLPVVAADFPVLREIVGGAECGLLVDPLDAGAIAGALRWLLDHPGEAAAMGQRGRQAVLDRYNWDGEARKLLALYAELTA